MKLLNSYDGFISWKGKEYSTMKISESAVSMTSEQYYSKYQENRIDSVSMWAFRLNGLQETMKDESAEISVSEESQVLLEKMKERKEQEQMAKKDWSDALEKKLAMEETALQVEIEDEQMIKTLRSVLEMLKQIHSSETLRNKEMLHHMDIQKVMSEDKHFSISVKQSGKSFGLSDEMKVLDLRSSSAATLAGTDVGSGIVAANGGTVWIRHTEKRGVRMEQEAIVFSATGIAKTANGKEIKFGVDLEMTKEFVDSFLELEDEEVVLTDSLVVDLENMATMVSEQKFYFDLDLDAQKDETSSLSQNSGFLSADENDWVFKEVKVWTKDATGKDKIVTLKGSSVGALCLGSSNSQFRLNNTAHKPNAIIQKTGAFRWKYEDAKMVRHMNLAV